VNPFTSSSHSNFQENGRLNSFRQRQERFPIQRRPHLRNVRPNLIYSLLIQWVPSDCAEGCSCCEYRWKSRWKKEITFKSTTPSVCANFMPSTLLPLLPQKNSFVKYTPRSDTSHMYLNRSIALPRAQSKAEDTDRKL
jgi:hypothetical protein